MTRWVAPWALLTGVFLLMVGSVDVWDGVLGGVVAALLLGWSGGRVSSRR